MKCVFSVLKDKFYSVSIENNRAYIECDNNVQSLNVSFRDCFNTLISLFSLKEDWVSEKCVNPVFKIEFINDDIKEEYAFKNEVPDNFNFFNAYINRLVGESIW